MKIRPIINFFQVQHTMKMYNKVVIHRNVFNSYEALSIIKQNDLQLAMCDTIFAFRGFNHSTKFSTVC